MFLSRAYFRLKFSLIGVDSWNRTQEIQAGATATLDSAFVQRLIDLFTKKK